ncbi:MAG: DUF1295 domain-containing protein [Eubacteriales bacterium]|jgi:steroid 5-alpha reductase family enzyme|nr:DUF1295 domain-containing protein [Eubacteriales bacterium]
MSLRQNRLFGFIYISVVYLIAAIVGVYTFSTITLSSLLIRLFWADIAATLFVYCAGLMVRNASVYDPYWSVAPMMILIALSRYFSIQSPVAYCLVFIICFWGVRLTLNWAYTFRGLHHQDWRYNKLHDWSPRYFPLVSLTGIHLFPTLVVFFALIPAVYFLQDSTLNGLTVLGLVICLSAAILQMVADFQMHRFRKQNQDPKRVISAGLWRYARHPNYLGEILLWWGVYLVMLSSRPDRWHLGFGALINTLMFFIISIPLAEKRLRLYKLDYERYRRQTRLLLPIPRKSV